MKKNKPLPAGALPFVLQLGLLFMFLISGFIAWVYMSNLSKQKYVNEIQHENEIRKQITAFTHLKNNNKNQNLKISRYGLFDLITTFNTTPAAALVGPSSKDVFHSLYLPNRGNTLYVGEAVSLVGNLSISPAGLRPTHLKKESSISSGARQYQLFESDYDLPQIDSITYHNLNKMVQFKQWGNLASPLVENIIQQSFFDPLYIVELDRSFRLTNVYYAGHIWLRSTEPIHISAEAKLYDIVISAPEIYIEAGFQGRIQAFASKYINVSDQCFLQYPSVIWVNQIDTLEDNIPAIDIGHDSNVQGFIGFTKRKNNSAQKREIVLGSNSKVYGRIYCQAMLESAADITGTVYTQDLGVVHQGTLFRHHLLEGSIRAEKSLYPSTELPFIASNEKKIIQWLY